MAIEDAVAALVSELKNLIKTVQSSGSMSNGGDIFSEFKKQTGKTNKQVAKTIIEQKKLNEVYKKSSEGIISHTKAMKKLMAHTKNLDSATELASKQFTDLFNKLDSSDLDAVAKQFRKNLEQSGDAVLQNIAKQVKSGEDLVAIQRGMATGSLDQFKKLLLSTEDLNKSDVVLERSFRNLAVETSKTVDNVKNGATASQRLTTRIKGLSKGVVDLTGIVTAAVGPFIDVAKSAAQTGTQMEFVQAGLMGMSPQELNQLQAEHIQLIRSSNMTFDTFNKSISENASSLITYTGSLRDAIRVQASSMDLAKVLGANQKKFTQDQEETFKRLNRTVSMSAEQFMEMNKQLIQSHDVRSNLYKIDVNRRATYMKDLQSSYEKLRLDGLLHDEAMKVIDAFAAIGAESPKERLKKAARLQAVMGAMGMGQQGAEAAQLYRGGLRGKGEAEKFSGIMKDLQKRMGSEMGKSFQSELMMSSMIQTAGLEDLLGPTSKFADLNIKQTTAITNLETVQKELGGKHNELLTSLININDQIRASLTGPIAKTIERILVTVGGLKVLGMFKNMGGGLLGGTRGLLGKVAGRSAFLSRGVGLMGAAGGLAVAGAGAAGGLIGTEIYKHNATAIGGISDAVVHGIENGFSGIKEVFGLGPDTKTVKGQYEKIADITHGNAKSIQKSFETSRRGTEYWEKHLQQVIKYLEQGKDRSEAMIAVLKENGDWGKWTAEHTKKTTEAIDKQTKQQEEQHKDSKEETKKGYRVQWLKVPRPANGKMGS